MLLIPPGAELGCPDIDLWGDFRSPYFSPELQNVPEDTEGASGEARRYPLLSQCVSEDCSSKVSVSDASPASPPVQCVRASAAPTCSVAWARPWWRCGAQSAAAPTSPVVSPSTETPPPQRWRPRALGGRQEQGRHCPPGSGSPPPEPPEGSLQMAFLLASSSP